MSKVVIVTGSIRGIGLGIAEGFLEQGYRVVLNYHSDDTKAKETLKSLNTDQAILIKADVTQANEREKLIAETLKAFGQVDVLVNNAGIIRPGRPLELTESNLQALMECNVYAPIFLSQLFANHLIKEQRAGAIVNILSVGAHKPGNIGYCTTKAAFAMASKCLAGDFAKHNIRVNSVSPGFVVTDLNRKTLANNPGYKEQRLERIPMKRTGECHEIAGAAVYLASDAASYVTGTDIIVDGGGLLM